MTSMHRHKLGTVDESNVTIAIFDRYDDIELITVDYLPYLLSSDPNGELRSVMPMFVQHCISTYCDS